jgi:hypothetical protein
LEEVFQKGFQEFVEHFLAATTKFILKNHIISNSKLLKTISAGLSGRAGLFLRFSLKISNKMAIKFTFAHFEDENWCLSLCLFLLILQDELSL